jgi:Fe-S-cluster containining protein
VKQWTCQRDGACCTQPKAMVMTAQEWAALAPHAERLNVRVDVQQHGTWTLLKAQPCPFYDASAKACQVYEDRPYNCRRFQCGRWEPSREPFNFHPLTVIKNDNDLRWSYRANQAEHQPWAVAHGWPPA